MDRRNREVVAYKIRVKLRIKEKLMIDSTGNISKASTLSTNRVSRANEAEAKELSPGAAPAASTADSIEITQASQDLMAAAELSKTSETVDMDKIARIKEALSEGNYPLDSQRTAEKMIELEGLISDIGKN
jgi:negative regulator of flagellin synthesis FlgM